jgi:DNA-binding GntR family transcriptional regulator
VTSIAYEDLNEKVYKALKQMILTGELQPGTKLRQEDLSGRLGVSRTPLLSAFSKLQKEMLIEILPRRGACVRKCSLEDLYEVAELRMRLEPLGAREAAEKARDSGVAALHARLEAHRNAVAVGDHQAIKEADYHFHMEIMQLSGNKTLIHIISSFNIVLISNQRGLLKDPATSLREHEAIFSAIGAFDPEAAERAMGAHLAGIKQGIAALMAADMP